MSNLRNTHRHLFAGVGGQVEDADAEKGDEDTRDDEVHRVEQSLAANPQRERDQGLVMALRVIERVVDEPRTRPGR